MLRRDIFQGTMMVGELIAYARLLPPGLRYPEVNLGRVVVRKPSLVETGDRAPR